VLQFDNLTYGLNNTGTNNNYHQVL